MKIFVVRALQRIGILRVDLSVQRAETLSDALPDDPNTLLLIEDGGIQKWACFSCPGGCGQNIHLSLNPNRRPRWKITLDFWFRPSITPSVHQKNACGCHFWVKRGRIEWCRGERPMRPNSADRSRVPEH